MDFKDKKVAIVGAGIEGVSTARYLQKKGAEISVFDKKEEREIDNETLSSLRKAKAKTYLGPENQYLVRDFKIIFRSPGVRLNLPELLEAKKRGSVLTSQTKLFFDESPAKIIGITGTKGKGTTSSLLYEILKKEGQDVFLGGNIGNPPLDFIAELTSESIVVLELSSFQLIDLHKSPYLAVILMVTSEHLDWHWDNNEYVNAKKNLVRFQNENDISVVNHDFPTSELIGSVSKATKFLFSVEDKAGMSAYINEDEIIISTDETFRVANTKEIILPGRHNLQNILAASLSAKLLGVSKNNISNGIKTFKGLEHRLEFVRKFHNVSFYNDSFSTIPETTIAALKAFNRPRILIAGGSSKNSDFNDLGKVITQQDVKALLLIGEEARRIKKSVEDNNSFRGKIFEGFKTMNEIVQKASEIMQEGDIVLLSPACASFGWFKNYKDRGQQFKDAVNSLT